MMKQKTDVIKRCALFAVIPAINILPKRKPELSSKAYAAKTVFPSFVWLEINVISPHQSI